MHSSLPQQLTNFAFSRSRLLHAAFRMDRAARDPPVARRDRHLPASRGNGPGDRAGVPTVLIENAPGRATRRSPARAPTSAGSWVLPADAPMVLYTGTFEAYQGLDLLFDAARIVLGEAAGRAVRARRRPAGPDRGARRPRQRRRPRRQRDLRRPASRRGDPAVTSMPPTCWSRRAAAAPTRR